MSERLISMREAARLAAVDGERGVRGVLPISDLRLAEGAEGPEIPSGAEVAT